MQQANPHTLQWEEANGWRRAFARAFDLYWEISLLTMLLIALVPPNALLRELLPWLALPLILLLDTATYALAGVTPGRKLFQLTICDQDQQPLSPQRYLQRNGLFWPQGLALGIPLLCVAAPLWQLWRLQYGKPASYDVKAGNKVFGPPLSPTRMLLYPISLIVITLALTLLGIALRMLTGSHP